ncbi:hypothetical protein PYW08_014469 [Mythimna loreyi]|uniref:Uncharacterized protein n=1 Tax=Mythimna loreyi TaxID=667449 RepID=A0ACC2R2L5_9NEOP|nr:hypothetical protein PYW08_014469 [Mythimna loreyi]
MVLYGAPVWSNRLSGVRRCRAKINSLQRRMAIRIARGYRTVSFEAATLLARFPPLDILADMDAKVYNHIRDIRQSGNSVPGAVIVRVRRQERRHALERWRERLQQPQFSRKRVVDAVLPHFETWLKRGERISYRLTQVLTGHGCFGEYLKKIGREATANCHHCEDDLDSAQHTLEECPAWASERQVLVAKIGRDLSLPAVVTAMLAETENWRAMASFCETVMIQKEAAERDRERTDPSRRRRRQRVNHLNA